MVHLFTIEIFADTLSPLYGPRLITYDLDDRFYINKIIVIMWIIFALRVNARLIYIMMFLHVCTMVTGGYFMTVNAIF